jgi:MFS family permease
VVTAVLVKFGETSSFYIFAVFIVSYATQKLGFARNVTLLAVACGAFVCIVAVPLCGALADRLGRRQVFAVGSIGIILFAAPYFWLLSQRSVLLLFVAMIVAMGVIWPLVTATLSTLLAEAFPAHVRYSGITFGYQIGAALVGGTAPLIATLLLSADHGRWRWIAAFIALSSAISLAAVAGATPAAVVRDQGHRSDVAAGNNVAVRASVACDQG